MTIQKVSSVNFKNNINFNGRYSKDDKNTSSENSFRPAKYAAVPMVALMAMNPSLLNSKSLPIKEQSPNVIELGSSVPENNTVDNETLILSPKVTEPETHVPIDSMALYETYAPLTMEAIRNGKLSNMTLPPSQRPHSEIREYVMKNCAYLRDEINDGKIEINKYFNFYKGQKMVYLIPIVDPQKVKGKDNIEQFLYLDPTEKIQHPDQKLPFVEKVIYNPDADKFFLKLIHYIGKKDTVLYTEYINIDMNLGMELLGLGLGYNPYERLASENVLKFATYDKDPMEERLYYMDDMLDYRYKRLRKVQ